MKRFVNMLSWLCRATGVIFLFILLVPRLLAADGDLASAMEMYDTNANGKMDRVVVKITNATTQTGHVYSTSGWAASDNGNQVTISSVNLSGSPTANPQVYFVNLNESDPDLTVDTANPDLEISYTQQGLGLGTEWNVGVNEITAITNSDVGNEAESDKAVPISISATFYDGNGDGKLDLITSIWSESIKPVVAGGADWAISSAAHFAGLVEGLVECNSGSAGLNECDYNFTTSTVKTNVGDLTLAYSPSFNSVQDLLGNAAAPRTFSGASSPPLTDAAAPLPKTVEFFDVNGDGKLDLITSIWSEPLGMVISGKDDWAISSPGVQFTSLTEGTVECAYGAAGASECDYNFTTSTIKTDVGDLQLIYTAGATVKDMSNNLAASANFTSATTPPLSDKAAPIIVILSYFDADYNGTIESVGITFSETVAGAGSIMAPNDLLFTNVGDFAGMSFGTNNSDVILANTPSVSLTLGAPANVVDTYDDSAQLAFSTRNNFHLEDAFSNANAILGSQSQVTISDKAAPVIKDLKYLDNNGNGRIDRFLATFSETVMGTSFLSSKDLVFSSGGTAVGDFAGAAFGADATDTITSNTTVATIVLGTEATVADTKENSGTISVDSQNLFGLQDAVLNSNTNLATMSHITFTDGAAPYPTNFIMNPTVQDSDYNGRLDLVTVKWSENISSVPNAAASWAITSVTDFMGLSEGIVECNSGLALADECKYNFTTSTTKTDLGDLTLAYAGTNVTDGTNIAATYTFKVGSTPPLVDGAPPIFVSAKANSDTNVNVIMSEPVATVIFGAVPPPYNWTATGLNITGVAVNAGTIDMTVTPIGNNAFTASDFAYTGMFGSAIQDSIPNKTPLFSNKLIADGQPPVISVSELIANESACTGAGGTVCRISDVITFSWDNSLATGDGNTDIGSVTADLSDFGGSAIQTLYDDGTHGDTSPSDQIYTYNFTVIAGNDDSGANTFRVTATDTSANSATSGASLDTAPVDNIPPIIGTPGSLSLFLDNNSNGTAEIGDKVSYSNPVPSAPDGDNYTIDLSTLTGNAAATSVGSPYTVLSGILNATLSFTEAATDNAGNTLTGLANPLKVDNLTSSGFNSASVNIVNLNASANTSATITFNSSLDLPANGKIAVTFPAGFEISGLNDVTNESNIETILTPVVAGQTVTLTRSAASAIPAGTVISFSLSPVVNPVLGGLTGTFGLATKTNAGLNLSSVSTIPGVTIIAPPPPPLPPSPTPTGGGGGGGGGGSYLAGIVNKSISTAEVSPSVTAEEGEGEMHKAAPTFTDIVGHWAETYIDEIAALGIVDGKTPTTYAPDDYISRAELLKIALNAFEVALPEAVTKNPLPDVAMDDWFAPYVASAYENQIIYGFASGLGPNMPATRGMATTVLAKAAGFEDVQQNFDDRYLVHEDWSYAHFPDVLMDAYYSPFIAYLYEKGVISGYEDGTFGPGNPITRAEIAKIVVNLLDLMGE